MDPASQYSSQSPSQLWLNKTKEWYPDSTDLLEDFLAFLPFDLVLQVISRYEQHGEEYLLDDKIGDRRINKVMQSDNIQLIEEEITDAVFNVLALVFRYGENIGGGGILGSLVSAWQELQLVKEEHFATAEQ